MRTMPGKIDTISIDFPKRLVFGDHSLDDFIRYFQSMSYRNVFLLADPNVRAPLEKLRAALTGAGINCTLNTEIKHEPTISEFYS
ncbi:MAG: iron-containing alcohol dehydrogenase, partial [Bacteroidales bacterium]|nr:iron-containing alcohol dehydrogenase [Bacteroidales bacterium]